MDTILRISIKLSNHKKFLVKSFVSFHHFLLNISQFHYYGKMNNNKNNYHLREFLIQLDDYLQFFHIHYHVFTKFIKLFFYSLIKLNNSFQIIFGKNKNFLK